MQDVRSETERALADAANRRLDATALAPQGIVDPATLGRSACLDQLVALQRLAAHIDGMRLATLARLQQLPQLVPGKDYLREEVGCALAESFPVVAELMSEARRVSGPLPQLLHEMVAGEVDHPRARVMLRGTCGVDDEVGAAVVERLLPGAGRHTRAELGRDVRRAVADLDPAGAAERHAVAVQGRRVEVRPGDDGMAELRAWLSAESAAAVATRLQARADGHLLHCPDDPRTAHQRRADALVELVCRDTDADTDELPTVRTWQGRDAVVHVTVALSTLMAIDEQPGEIDGYGPIPSELARRIAADPTSTWRRLVTDPLGRPVELSPRRYSPPAWLTDLVVARDPTCTMPGCGRPARRCELDHRVPFSRGGPTSAANLGALCPRHHRLKHEGGWDLRAGPGDTSEWITPTGRRHRSRPDRPPRDTSRFAMARLSYDRALIRLAGPGTARQQRTAGQQDTGHQGTAGDDGPPPPF